MRITQQDDEIVFEYEQYGGFRLVPLGTALPAPAEPSFLGDSVAHYEGDALVVRSVNLLSGHSIIIENYQRDDTVGEVVLSMQMVLSAADGGDSQVLTQSRVQRDDYAFAESDCLPPMSTRVAEAVKVVAQPVPPSMPPPPPEEDYAGPFSWLQYSTFSYWMADSLVAWPVAIAMHRLGLTIVIGLSLFAGLGLLGAFGSMPATALLQPAKLAWVGFALAVLSGFAMFAPQANDLIYSRAFLLKTGFVFFAALAAVQMQRKLVAEGDAAIAGLKLVAIAAIACWLGAIIASQLPAGL